MSVGAANEEVNAAQTHEADRPSPKKNHLGDEELIVNMSMIVTRHSEGMSATFSYCLLFLILHQTAPYRISNN